MSEGDAYNILSSGLCTDLRERFTLKTADPGGAMFVWCIWGVIRGVCDCPAVLSVNQGKTLAQSEPLSLSVSLLLERCLLVAHIN